jgi:hypothetical protein
MTLEEFDALPESNRPIQLIEGQLVVAPSPDRFHQRLSGGDFHRNIALPEGASRFSRMMKNRK